MFRVGGPDDETWEDTDKLELLLVFFTILPEEFFCKEFAFRVVMQQIFLGPIIFIGHLAICPDHDSETARSKDEPFDFMFQASLDNIFGALHCRLDNLVLILGHPWRDRRGHM